MDLRDPQPIHRKRIAAVWAEAQEYHEGAERCAKRAAP